MLRFRLLGLIFALILLALPNFAQTANWQWRELTPTSGSAPEVRRNGAAIYDPVGKRVIIFGGTGNNGTMNDTWAFDLATRTWTRLQTTGATPAPRLGFDAVYDSVGHQMVIYAGQASGFFNDTWTLNLTTLEWRDVSPSSRPRARYGHSAIFDPVSRSLVQFAGFTEESRRFQDTQSFSLATNTWQDWTPSGTKPEVRCLLTAAYDRTKRRMIIYGGQRSGFLDDLWAFDLASRTWENLTVSPRPSGRLFTSSFVDRDGRFIVFGGSSASGNLNELQSFDLQTRQWTKLNVANPPSKRNGALTAFIEGENRFIVFGGTGDNGLLNDVWELRGATALATVSAASYVGSVAAPESIVSGFGTNLATGTAAATSRSLPLQLAGTSIAIRDSNNVEHRAPLFYVSPTQVNYLIPREVANGAATVTLTSSDGAIANGTLTIASVAPGLFSATADGRGYAAAYAVRVRNGIQTEEPLARWDATLSRFVAVPLDVSDANDRVYLIVFGTGWRNRSSRAAVSVRIGNVAYPVEYADAQPEYAGLDQINVLLPPSLAGRGEVELIVVADSKETNVVRVAFK
ncbi:MAG TPA: kelch repeat-containing protein [Blastocatellia bacterium]|nr:kelch repeat-containing protein [Blastocatellia bacterium]